MQRGLCRRVAEGNRRGSRWWESHDRNGKPATGLVESRQFGASTGLADEGHIDGRIESRSGIDALASQTGESRQRRRHPGNIEDGTIRLLIRKHSSIDKWRRSDERP